MSHHQASHTPFSPAQNKLNYNVIPIKWTVWPNLTKIITLNANSQEIITLKTFYGLISQKLLL